MHTHTVLFQIINPEREINRSFGFLFLLCVDAGWFHPGSVERGLGFPLSPRLERGAWH